MTVSYKMMSISNDPAQRPGRWDANTKNKIACSLVLDLASKKA